MDAARIWEETEIRDFVGRWNSLASAEADRPSGDEKRDALLSQIAAETPHKDFARLSLLHLKLRETWPGDACGAFPDPQSVWERAQEEGYGRPADTEMQDPVSAAEETDGVQQERRGRSTSPVPAPKQGSSGSMHMRLRQRAPKKPPGSPGGDGREKAEPRPAPVEAPKPSVSPRHPPPQSPTPNSQDLPVIRVSLMRSRPHFLFAPDGSQVRAKDALTAASSSSAAAVSGGVGDFTLPALSEGRERLRLDGRLSERSLDDALLEEEEEGGEAEKQQGRVDGIHRGDGGVFDASRGGIGGQEQFGDSAGLGGQGRSIKREPDPLDDLLEEEDEEGEQKPRAPQKKARKGEKRTAEAVASLPSASRAFETEGEGGTVLKVIGGWAEPSSHSSSSSSSSSSSTFPIRESLDFNSCPVEPFMQMPRTCPWIRRRTTGLLRLNRADAEPKADAMGAVERKVVLMRCSEAQGAQWVRQVRGPGTIGRPQKRRESIREREEEAILQAAYTAAASAEEKGRASGPKAKTEKARRERKGKAEEGSPFSISDTAPAQAPPPALMGFEEILLKSPSSSVALKCSLESLLTGLGREWARFEFFMSPIDVAFLGVSDLAAMIRQWGLGHRHKWPHERVKPVQSSSREKSVNGPYGVGGDQTDGCGGEGREDFLVKRIPPFPHPGGGLKLPRRSWQLLRCTGGEPVVLTWKQLEKERSRLSRFRDAVGRLLAGRRAEIVHFRELRPFFSIIPHNMGRLAAASYGLVSPPLDSASGLPCLVVDSRRDLREAEICSDPSSAMMGMLKVRLASEETPVTVKLYDIMPLAQRQVDGDGGVVRKSADRTGIGKEFPPPGGVSGLPFLTHWRLLDSSQIAEPARSEEELREIRERLAFMTDSNPYTPAISEVEEAQALVASKHWRATERRFQIVALLRELRKRLSSSSDQSLPRDFLPDIPDETGLSLFFPDKPVWVDAKAKAGPKVSENHAGILLDLSPPLKKDEKEPNGPAAAASNGPVAPTATQSPTLTSSPHLHSDQAGTLPPHHPNHCPTTSPQNSAVPPSDIRGKYLWWIDQLAVVDTELERLGSASGMPYVS
uniref:Uncharacterized protein n=1 Tax=Chromera velia CCMP2878 TaxID=1169474 RepID=A0A0G4FES1_9ALVE|eukprot:Cvel_16492.t1-p1 / transcript=Cvel_16492.t1 / gene=Cvel_16492 / organism=Chromera_velia_CCMP2878 / gene_product=hypothetical protein / transcript_product=hypothetical protein / location=Cvel_scaffold1272:6138-12272(-) / protein_length=1079 / sequence_SO=supercontig / SO=protein_coding / is_pseudo=false